MGYAVYEGPDVETVYNTFDALNSPENHPSRDMTDTFYIKGSHEEHVLNPIPLLQRFVQSWNCPFRTRF